MGFFDFLKSFSSETGDNSLVSNIRKDRINVIVVLDFLLHDCYVMVLDFEYDMNLIDQIKESRISISRLLRIAKRRGKKVESLFNTMQSLSKVVNDEDFLLRVEEDGDDDESIRAYMSFFNLD